MVIWHVFNKQISFRLIIVVASAILWLVGCNLQWMLLITLKGFSVSLLNSLGGCLGCFEVHESDSVVLIVFKVFTHNKEWHDYTELTKELDQVIVNHVSWQISNEYTWLIVVVSLAWNWSFNCLLLDFDWLNVFDDINHVLSICAIYNSRGGL